MGSRDAALSAGKNPKTIPIAEVNVSESVIAHVGMSADWTLSCGMSVRIDMNNWAQRRPMMPPRRQRMTASVRNCKSMIAGFAPIAFLRPISLVLSETETSMIFMIPMPPTRSEMPTIHAAMPRMTLAMDLNSSMILSGMRTIKLSGCPGLIWRVFLRKNSTCAAASDDVSGEDAVPMALIQGRCHCQSVLKGMYAFFSSFCVGMKLVVVSLLRTPIMRYECGPSLMA